MTRFYLVDSKANIKWSKNAIKKLKRKNLKKKIVYKYKKVLRSIPKTAHLPPPPANVSISKSNKWIMDQFYSQLKKFKKFSNLSHSKAVMLFSKKFKHFKHLKFYKVPPLFVKQDHDKILTTPLAPDPKVAYEPSIADLSVGSQDLKVELTTGSFIPADFSKEVPKCFKFLLKLFSKNSLKFITSKEFNFSPMITPIFLKARNPSKKKLTEAYKSLIKFSHLFGYSHITIFLKELLIIPHTDMPLVLKNLFQFKDLMNLSPDQLEKLSVKKIMEFSGFIELESVRGKNSISNILRILFNMLQCFSSSFRAFWIKNDIDIFTNIPHWSLIAPCLFKVRFSSHNRYKSTLNQFNKFLASQMDWKYTDHFDILKTMILQIHTPINKRIFSPSIISKFFWKRIKNVCDSTIANDYSAIAFWGRIFLRDQFEKYYFKHLTDNLKSIHKLFCSAPDGASAYPFAELCNFLTYLDTLTDFADITIKLAIQFSLIYVARIESLEFACWKTTALRVLDGDQCLQVENIGGKMFDQSKPTNESTVTVFESDNSFLCPIRWYNAALLHFKPSHRNIEEPIFADKAGTPWRIPKIRDNFKRVLKQFKKSKFYKNGFKNLNIKFHSHRVTTIDLLFQLDVQIQATSVISGHSINSTAHSKNYIEKDRLGLSRIFSSEFGKLWSGKHDNLLKNNIIKFDKNSPVFKSKKESYKDINIILQPPNINNTLLSPNSWKNKTNFKSYSKKKSSFKIAKRSKIIKVLDNPGFTTLSSRPRRKKTKSNKYNDDYVEDPDRYLFEQ